MTKSERSRRFLEKWRRILIPAILVLLIGYIDFITPYEYSMELLYFLPLAITALSGSLPSSVAMSCYTATTWFLADYFVFASPMKAYSIQSLLWIATIRLGTLCIFSYLAVRVNNAMRVQRESAEKLRCLNQELEQRVAERTAALSRSLQEMEHISYAIVHDMRAPLRAMMGFAQLAEEECAACKPVDPSFIRRIKTASRRMDQLITDSLSYSRAVRQHLPLDVVDLGHLLRDLLETYPNLHSDNADILLSGDLPRVLGNEAGLTQCFGNLLDNAVKFAKPGTRAKIRVWAEPVNRVGAGEVVRSGPGATPSNGFRPGPNSSSSETHGDLVRIWIEDKGIGISQEFQKHIFGLFERGTNDQPGTGAGLAIVHKLVERMRGEVGLESQENIGTRVWVLLPAAPVQTADPVQSPVNRPSLRGLLRTEESPAQSVG